jgi:hypothetical protein
VSNNSRAVAPARLMSSLAAAFVLAALIAPTTASAGRIPNGKYACYADTTYVYEQIKIRSATDYTLIPSSGKSKPGTYQHGHGKRIKWTSGPLKKLANGGRHIKFGNGKDGIKVIFDDAEWECVVP